MHPFVPHPLLRGGQLQTVAGQLLGRAPPPGPHTVDTVTLSDGDRLLLHVDAPLPTVTAKAPVVLLMHGLGGSSESAYILRIAAKLT